MYELLKATQIIGVRRLLRLRRAQKSVWPNLINGHVTTRVIQTLLNVGFFDEIHRAGKVNVKTFAQAKNLDESILRSMCDSLYASAILDVDGDDYSFTEEGELIADTGQGWFRGIYGYEDLYRDLEGMLRKERTYGVDVHRKTDFVARGSGEIESALYFPLAVDVIKSNGYRNLLDLACGDGTFLRHACKAVPSLNAFGIDMAEDAIDDAKRLTAEAGLSDRLKFLAKDVTTLQAPPPEMKNVDIVSTFFLMHEILHHGPQAVVGFLKAFRRLFPGIPLMIFEVDRPSPAMMRKGRHGMAIPYFLHHDLSHQKPVARHEWLPMLREAGFTDIQERNLAYARSVIFTVR